MHLDEDLINLVVSSMKHVAQVNVHNFGRTKFWQVSRFFKDYSYEIQSAQLVYSYHLNLRKLFK